MEQETMEEMLCRLAGKKEWAGICQILTEMNPSDAAKALECLPVEKQCELFWRLKKDVSADICAYLEPDVMVRLVEYFLTPREESHGETTVSGHTSDAVVDKLGDILNEMPADDAADMVDDLQDELPAELVDAILKEVDTPRRRDINRILKYPENSAGSIMTLEYIMLGETLTTAEALEQIRSRGRNKETIYNCYAIGPNRKLRGVVSLRDIILSKPNVKIRDIMTSPAIFARTHEDQEAVASRFQEYDLIAMPVVDSEEKLVGIITIDDVMDVMEEENTEDIEKMAALHPSEEEYLKTGVFQLARNRLVWLILLMVSAIFTEAVMGKFQGLLSTAAYLAAFVPALMNTSGNCGSQASTLVIRGLALVEITLPDVLQVMWKEMRVGCVVAVVLTVVNWLRLHFFTTVKYVNQAGEPVNAWKVELVVSLTLFAVIILAKMVGALLPLCAKRMKCDPALVAAPMLTTIMDALTLIIFFSIAGPLLHLAA